MMRAACLRTNAAKSVLGVRQREQTYEGTTTVRSELAAAACLGFYRAAVPRQRIQSLLEIQPGQEVTVEFPSESDFDCTVVVDRGVAEAHLVRGGSYRLRANPEATGGPVLVEPLELPERKKSDRLASVPGLSFGFSASAWMLVYQLGAAECLQNNGVTKNPYVRCVGSSGGALGLFTMLIGCDMRALKDSMKSVAARIHRDMSQAAELRKFLLEALEEVVRDGTIEHPAFREGRMEVVFSETGARSLMSLGALAGFAKERRAKFFADSAEAVIALIASSSFYFTGLPFIASNESGQRTKVADGCLTDWTPAVDEFTITLKPFCDSLNVLGAESDVGPTEFVPSRYAVYPRSAATLDHLYELGYRDMESWLDNHLDDRIAKLQAAGRVPAAPLPPVEFTCKDDGTEWVSKVRASLPIAAKEQLRARPASGTVMPASESPAMSRKGRRRAARAARARAPRASCSCFSLQPGHAEAAEAAAGAEGNAWSARAAP